MELLTINVVPDDKEEDRGKWETPESIDTNSAYFNGLVVNGICNKLQTDVNINMSKLL